jgi:hypothetical protein
MASDTPRNGLEWAYVRSCWRGFDHAATHPKREVIELWEHDHHGYRYQIFADREKPLTEYAAAKWIAHTGRNPWTGARIEVPPPVEPAWVPDGLEFSEW